MRHTLSKLAVSGLFALGIAVAASSAQAAAISAGGAAANVVKTVNMASESNLIEVRDRDRRHYRRHHRRHHHRRHYRPRSGVYFEFGTRDYRPPYYTRPPVYVRPRYVRPRPAYRVSSAHVRWCYDRYRSYRASDNTFQPYNGPRRACISPYMR